MGYLYLFISKASSVFGMHSHRLWKVHNIRLETKIAVYHAVVLSSLLYCCESWCRYRRQLRKLKQFCRRCLRNIARIRWQDKVPNIDVLQRCQSDSTEATPMKHSPVSLGHVIRMPDTRLSKRIFYGHLPGGGRLGILQSSALV